MLTPSTNSTASLPPDQVNQPKRPPRIDKGSIELTDRDLRCLRWIGEQYTVRFDTLQKLLGREPQNLNDNAPHDGILSERNTRKVVRRWFDEELVIYKKILVAERGYVWLTPAGMRAAKLNYKLYAPNVGALTHLHAINELRVKLEGRYQERLVWTPERELQRAHDRIAKDHWRNWHVPDAVIVLDQRQEVALEVELTKKTDKRLAETVERLAQQYKGVWYFVSDDVRDAVVKAIGSRTQTFRVYNFAEVLT